MKIMIVDDHAEMSNILNIMITYILDGEVEFVMCKSGEESIAKYPIEKPDWVLMDIEMGGINGFEATEEILNMNASAKIIIVTSHDSLSFRQRAEKINVKGFVLKERLTEIETILKLH